MPSKTLYGVWAFLDFLLLAAGGISIALSVIWRAPDVLRGMVISDLDLTFGLILGIAFCAAFVISVGGVIQPNHVVIGLQIFNYALVFVGSLCVVVGSTVWFWTLREQENFRQVWLGLATAKQAAIQEKLRCCGYTNFTDVFPQGFCTNAVAQNITGCQTQILNFADNTLNNIFTTIYGFMAVVCCLFLATLCVINKRLEQERFRRIDAKRGGRGFV